MMPVVQAIRARGVTILIVEHVMQAVMSLCDTVHVLAQGRIIASGPPGAVSRDASVVEAYLGHGAAARMQEQESKARQMPASDASATPRPSPGGAPHA
jgi:branched-chain amino acid transport system ATP-binding protein